MLLMHRLANKVRGMDGWYLGLRTDGCVLVCLCYCVIMFNVVALLSISSHVVASQCPKWECSVVRWIVPASQPISLI
jgi:hypothetical protein